MFGGNFAGLYVNFFIGALGYAITMMLLNWHWQGWAHVQQALPHYFLVLPLSLVTCTILLVALHVVGLVLNGRR